MNPLVTISIAVSTVLISAFGSYLAFRVQFERFLARDTEREKHWMRWQESITRDVEQLKAERNFHGRIEQCERFIEELREHKHVVVDPHIRAVGQLKDRIERLEKSG